MRLKGRVYCYNRDNLGSCLQPSVSMEVLENRVEWQLGQLAIP